MTAPPAPGSLRTRAARGTVVNAAWLVGLQMLGFFKGFIVAGFLTAQEYGVWGLLVISLGTLLWIAQIGVDDKYVQQQHPDQEKAFQLAFTLQSMLAGVFMVVIAVGVPLFALAYDQPKIIAPGLVLALAMPTSALSTPLWTFYRNMDYLKQRRLQMWDPITSFAVTCALAVAGLGYWSLVVGTVAGAWAGAVAAIRASPYKLRFHYEKGTLREYATFSWPILVSSASGTMIAQIPILFAQRELGTAAIGALTLAGTISLYAGRVDDIVTQTLYPAICRVTERRDLLFESFTKSNRLALLWGVPCGVGIALFADDIVHFVIGDHWKFAVPVIQILALVAGFNQFGFNWSAFYKALGRTRPLAVSSAVMLVAVLALAIPGIYLDGVRGYALGMAGATAVLIGMRIWYLMKLFPAFGVVAHALRAIVPTVPAAVAVVAVRAAENGGPRTAVEAVAEAALYVAIVLGSTFVSERTLLREMVGYLRGRAVPA